MPALSTLLRFSILDAQAAAAELLDFAISQLDTDYPLVTHLILRTGRPPTLAFPWNAVRKIDWADRQIQVESYETG